MIFLNPRAVIHYALFFICTGLFVTKGYAERVFHKEKEKAKQRLVKAINFIKTDIEKVVYQGKYQSKPKQVKNFIQKDIEKIFYEEKYQQKKLIKKLELPELLSEDDLNNVLEKLTEQGIKEEDFTETMCNQKEKVYLKVYAKEGKIWLTGILETIKEYGYNKNNERWINDFEGLKQGLDELSLPEELSMLYILRSLFEENRKEDEPIPYDDFNYVMTDIINTIGSPKDSEYIDRLKKLGESLKDPETQDININKLVAGLNKMLQTWEERIFPNITKDLSFSTSQELEAYTILIANARGLCTTLGKKYSVLQEAIQTQKDKIIAEKKRMDEEAKIKKMQREQKRMELKKKKNKHIKTEKSSH